MSGPPPDYVLTPNYGLFKPTVDADNDAWGGHLNANADTLDSLLHTQANSYLSLNGGTMLGPISLAADPQTAMQPVTLQYYNAHMPAVPGASTTLPIMDSTAAIGTGTTWARADHVHPSDTTRLTKAQTDALYLTPAQANGAYLSLSGGTLSGPLILNADPTTNLGATTKAYVDNNAGAVTISDTAPANPRNGALWWSSLNGQLYIRYPDPNTTQWVIANSMGGGIGEAPNDGVLYGRNGQAQGWQPAASPASVAANVGRNVLHNSLFNIAQRGNGPFTTNGYALDRWSLLFNTDTVSAGQASLPPGGMALDQSAKNYLYNTFTGSASAIAFTAMGQPIEDVRRLGGQTVILSFYAAAGVAGLKLGASIDQYFGTGGSPSARVNGVGQAVTLTAAWARYSLVFNLGSIVGTTVGTNNDHYTIPIFWCSSGSNNASRAGNVGVQSGTIQLWGVQLEVVQAGQTQPTALEHPDPQQDLAKCQRFFFASDAGAFTGGYAAASTGIYNDIPFPTTMRAAPTIAVTSPAYSNASGLTSSSANKDHNRMWVVVTAAGVGYATFNFTASADL